MWWWGYVDLYVYIFIIGIPLAFTVISGVFWLVIYLTDENQMAADNTPPSPPITSRRQRDICSKKMNHH